MISIDAGVYKLGFWSVIATIVAGVAAAFLPLDAPAGYDASHADRIIWLRANGGTFTAAWVVQIMAMTALTGMYLALAWQISRTAPVRAAIAGMVVLVSFIAFIIPKFIAIWTIPHLADAVVTGSVGAEMADSLLLILNVSIPFSLFTSFDFLGFWMYGIFGLLIAVPLYRQAGAAWSAKSTAAILGLFGVLFHGVLLGWLMEFIPPAELKLYSAPILSLLLVAVVAAAFNFWQKLAELKIG